MANSGQLFMYIVIGIAVPLFLRGCAKLFPNTTPMPSEAEFSKLEVQKWNLVSIGVFVVAAAAITFTLQKLLVLLHVAFLSLFQEGEFVVTPPREVFWVFAIFGGMCFSAIPMEIFLRKKMGVRYEAYCLASARASGYSFDSTKVMRVLYAVVLFGILLGTIGVFRSKLTFRGSDFTSCGPLSCEDHNYLEIAEIGLARTARAPNGTIVASNEIFIRFKDGKIWNPFLLRGEQRTQIELAKFLASKTGIEPKSVDLMPEQ